MKIEVLLDIRHFGNIKCQVRGAFSSACVLRKKAKKVIKFTG